MPKVGLVLSGGFAKGAYQIGVFKAIKEVFQEHPIQYVSASSVGVLNAYTFVQDKMDEAEAMWRGFSLSGLRAVINTCVRGSSLSEAIDNITRDLPPPTPCLYATYLNLSKKNLNYVNLRDVNPSKMSDYLLASVTLPILSRSVKIGKTKYADGALVDNIPVKPLMKHPFDYAFVVHFDNDHYQFENEYFDSKLIKINFLDDRLVKNSLAFDQNSVSYMINTGYEKSMTLFGVLFKNGIHDLEYIYQKNRFINDLRGKQKRRLTGDVVVNNINKVLKRVISYRI